MWVPSRQAAHAALNLFARTTSRLACRPLISMLSTTITQYNRVTSVRSRFGFQGFHSNLVCRSDCDFGEPCEYSECREAARKPICQKCNVGTTSVVSGRSSYDRKLIRSIDFTSYCKRCWQPTSLRAEEAPQYEKKSCTTKPGWHGVIKRWRSCLLE